jgi:uncharacterized membrane protein
LHGAAGAATGLAGVTFLAFAPATLSAATEVRQYGVLLFFICAALAAMERWLRERAPAWVVVYAVCLWGAILTHYTAAWVALALGIYMPLRLWAERAPRLHWAAWAASQLGALSGTTSRRSKRCCPYSVTRR